jgi:3D (Asp-Asp-Asp) domain-containing protein
MYHGWRTICGLCAAAGITFAALSGAYISALHNRIDALETQLVTSQKARADAVRSVRLPEVLETEPEPEEVAEIEPELQSLGTFKLTAYCPCPKCCGEWADGITYTMTEATPGRTVAVDPDVIPLGSTIYINGTPYVAEDIGGAIQGNRIDVFFPDHQTALQFGVQYAEVEIQEQ